MTDHHNALVEQLFALVRRVNDDDAHIESIIGALEDAGDAIASLTARVETAERERDEAREREEATRRANVDCMMHFEAIRADLAAAQAEADRANAEAPSQATRDVIAERARQIVSEGWTPKHDDAHANGELSMAAMCYATNSNIASRFVGGGLIPAAEIDTCIARCPAPPNWPWGAIWWRPTGRRRDLVKAGALILAEIDRLDRASLAQGGRDDG